MMFSFDTEKFNKFLNSYYRILVWLIFILIFTLGFFIILWPQYNDLKNNGIVDYDKALSLLEERQDYLQQVKIMQNNYEKITTRTWQNLEYILPPEDDIYLLFVQIESLAQENNLQLGSININESQIDATSKTKNEEQSLPKDIKKVSISMNVDGIDSYQNFKLFLDNLENNIRILNIESIAYFPDKTSYTIGFTTYYLANEKTATAEQALDK